MIKDKIEEFLKENKDKFHLAWDFDIAPDIDGDYEYFVVRINESIILFINILAEDEILLVWCDRITFSKEVNSWEELEELLLRYLGVTAQ